jgi:hypothetical protein
MLSCSASEVSVTLTLTKELASHFARTALGHVTREYPNKLDHVLTGPEDVKSPRELHPIFYGSFDWHSCVHGYWTLARCLRRFPDLPEAEAIRALFDEQFTPDKVAREIEYLARPSSRGFERPYGWAWALKLQDELLWHPAQDRRWSDALEPLEAAFVKRFKGYLPLATYPVRAGTHANTAFALVFAKEYALTVEDWDFVRLCHDKVDEWYSSDVDFGAGEPSQNDFLSPALIEALCMKKSLEPSLFRDWLHLFFPDGGNGEPRALFEPATVSDRTDGQIAHLDGLNLTRAWCWRWIGEAWGIDESFRQQAKDAAQKLIDATLPHVTGDYMGEHWLASFALLAVDLYDTTWEELREEKAVSHRWVREA